MNGGMPRSLLLARHRLCHLVRITTAVVLSTLVSVADAQERLVENTSEGQWSAQRSISLEPDLLLGEPDGEEYEVFGRIADIAVAKDGDIYVLDNGFVRVYRFDKEGHFLNFIGHRGPGPGELGFPTAIDIDQRAHVYVADGTKLCTFSPDGDYIDEFRHGLQNFVTAVRVDARHGIYIASADVLEQTILHKYNFEHGKVLSFCDSYAKGSDTDTRVEEVCAGGSIDILDGGTILFTQATPYEIRVFEPDGDLRARIFREGNILSLPSVQYGDGTVSIGSFAASCAIIALNDHRFLNVSKAPPTPRDSTTTILDLFDRNGVLLLTTRLGHHVTPKCSDRAGRLYAVDKSEYPRVVRYNMSF